MIEENTLMPRLDRLSQAGRNTLLTFSAQVNDGAPFALLGKPLSACRLGDCDHGGAASAERPAVRSGGADGPRDPCGHLGQRDRAKPHEPWLRSRADHARSQHHVSH